MRAFKQAFNRNLSERSGDGIVVSLDYDPVGEEIAVSVTSATDSFILYPPAHLALQVFNHPFAFRDRYLQAGRFDSLDHSRAVPAA